MSGVDDAQPLSSKSDQRGQRLEQVVRLLGRGLHRDAAVGGADFGEQCRAPSIGCAAPRCCHSSCLNTCAALAKAASASPKLDLVGGDDVAVELAPHRRGVRRALAHVGDERQRLVVDRDQRGGVLGDVAVVRDHHRHRLADIGDLAVGERERPQPCRAACRNWNAAPCGAAPSPAARSSSVSTACTPGSASAALLSMLRISACGCGLRTNAACSTPGSAMSSTKRPRAAQQRLVLEAGDARADHGESRDLRRHARLDRVRESRLERLGGRGWLASSHRTLCGRCAAGLLRNASPAFFTTSFGVA